MRSNVHDSVDQNVAREPPSSTARQLHISISQKGKDRVAGQGQKVQLSQLGAGHSAARALSIQGDVMLHVARAFTAYVNNSFTTIATDSGTATAGAMKGPMHQAPNTTRSEQGAVRRWTPK